MIVRERRAMLARDVRDDRMDTHAGNTSRRKSSMGVTMLYADRTSDASFVIENGITRTFAVRDFNFTSLIEARVDVRRV